MASARLTPTGRVICGMITLGKRTGYDIKQLVDKSTRHFWAASYGQIYPELKRLEEQGLIRGTDDPSGGRARTVYELTGAGEAALHAWLTDTSEPLFELRCETLLKLFFSDAVEPAERVGQLRAFRALQERRLDEFQDLVPHVADQPDGVRLSLEFGLAHTAFLIRWATEMEERLAMAAAR